MAKKAKYVRQPARTPRIEAHAREAFLDALAEGLSVTGAYRKAGLARSTVYDWRNEEPDFKQAWDDAIESGTDGLEDEAFRRACHGVPEPIVIMGRVAKNDDGSMLTVQKYSDGLMIQLLKGRRGDKFKERAAVDNTHKVSLAEDAPVLAPDEPLPENPIL